MAPNRIWMWSALSLAVLVGAAAGIIGGRLVFSEGAVLAAPPPEPNPPWFICGVDADPLKAELAEQHQDALRARLLDRLSGDLGLEASQRRELEALVVGKEKFAWGFWKKTRQEFCDLQDGFREKILELLDPEQKEIFAEMIAEKDRQQIEKVREWRERK